jgi:hypothetical protein
MRSVTFPATVIWGDGNRALSRYYGDTECMMHTLQVCLYSAMGAYDVDAGRTKYWAWSVIARGGTRTDPLDLPGIGWGARSHVSLHLV